MVALFCCANDIGFKWNYIDSMCGSLSTKSCVRQKVSFSCQIKNVYTQTQLNFSIKFSVTSLTLPFRSGIHPVEGAILWLIYVKPSAYWIIFESAKKNTKWICSWNGSNGMPCLVSSDIHSIMISITLNCLSQFACCSLLNIFITSIQ